MTQPRHSYSVGPLDARVRITPATVFPPGSEGYHTLAWAHVEILDVNGVQLFYSVVPEMQLGPTIADAFQRVLGHDNAVRIASESR